MTSNRLYPPHPSEHYDLVVVGAGPAGLSATLNAKELGLKCLLLEAGDVIEHRNPDSPKSIGRGVGGAGLYSDGKFSFFPSATSLWQLSDSDSIRTGYDWLQGILAPMGISVPAFPEEITTSKSTAKEFEKQYPSYYVSFDDRSSIIASMQLKLSEELRCSTRLLSLRDHEMGSLLYMQSEVGVSAATASAIIFAGGRLGPTEFQRIAPDLSQVYRRYEVGLRLEQKACEFVFRDNESVDVKKIYTDKSEEWRTFCTCRNGEVVEVDWDGLVALSGRSNGTETGRSNIGYNVRFNSLPKDSSILHELYKIISGQIQPQKISLEAYFSEEESIFGNAIDAKFRKRLRSLCKELKISTDSITAYGPCIEGVGYYPDINSNLKMNSRNIWVAGDSSGIFRGLTAAMISGYYCAKQVSNALSHGTKIPSYVKASKSDPMPVIFTAQSKEFFYCRDVICQFVLQKGLVPINPFRVFEYFLGDRVDRNTIRSGNNQLIATCDELWVFGTVSDGVLFEIVRARELKKPIRFFSIGTRTGDIRPLGVREVKFDPEIHAAKITREALLDLINDNVTLESKDSLQMEMSFKQNEPKRKFTR